jgi:hypothetical protein
MKCFKSNIIKNIIMYYIYEKVKNSFNKINNIIFYLNIINKCLFLNFIKNTINFKT